MKDEVYWIDQPLILSQKRTENNVFDPHSLNLTKNSSKSASDQ